MLASGNASSVVAVRVSRRGYERQAKADIQAPAELSGPSPPNITAQPHQLVSN